MKMGLLMSTTKAQKESGRTRVEQTKRRRRTKYSSFCRLNEFILFERKSFNK